jgi:hypothetical protein
VSFFKANRSSFRQENTHVVLRPKNYCHVQYSLPIVHYPKKINQIHALLFHLCKILFNFILQLTAISARRALYFRLSNIRYRIHWYFPSRVKYIPPRPPNSPSFNHPKFSYLVTSKNHSAIHYAIFSILLLLPFS